MDGDYQHNPSDIPKIAAPVLNGKADVAVGSRQGGNYPGASRTRKTGVWLLNNLASLKTGENGLDYECGFRCLSREAARKIRIRETGYPACTELVSSAVGAGLRTASVPISVKFYGKPGNGSAQQGIGVGKYLLEEIAYHKPLFFFGLAGIALLVCSALLGAFVVETFYSQKVLPIGSALLTVFTGVGGLVMLLMGINLYTLNAVLKKRGD